MAGLWTTLISAPRKFRAAILCLALYAQQAAAGEFDAHLKGQFNAQTYPGDSSIRDIAGSSSVDLQADLRLNFKHQRGSWSFDAAYQLINVHSELLQGVPPFTVNVGDDGRRLFNLSDVIADGENSLLLQRLDRFAATYTSEKTVLRFGRQALSWGNGLIYTPMDLVNPFDPAAIDTEYKAGDDMLYLQYLHDNGADVQAAHVFRRDLNSGRVRADFATTALKYHAFAGDTEFDLLLAESYGDAIIGAGFRHSIGGAIWGGDVVISETSRDTVVQLVSNLSYSWTWRGRNISGTLEYYFNGFGQGSRDYGAAALANNPDLLERLSRGESFSIGRHYLAASALVEITPLWTITPIVLLNASDPSALLQVVSNYSLGDNMTLIGSINIPTGANGSEFGGIDTALPGRYLSTDGGIFAQIAWYF